ncbi:hypothetical protein F5148DRAFT_1291377 [Russula earlei]|uniref:Uncharacterized protein n=1 Tax=Russula earlei TaxID=71964 RepID=A0ACC0TVA9_9AGAM|nr:hypothetical protein F5148DRAFT_1291377 [Russula earlei]
MKRIFTLLFSLLAINSFSQTAFTPGNLALFVSMDSVNNTGFKIVEINTTTANQTTAVTHLVDSTGTTPLRSSGSATSTGYLSNSNDGTLLCFAAHATSSASGNVNLNTARSVGTFTMAGALQVQTSYTGGSGNQTRGATTVNNATWFIGDQGGIYTNNATSASPSGNYRSAKAFGGNVFVFTASASAAPVGLVSAATGGTVTSLPGLPVGSSAYTDFAMVSSANNGSYDVLYVISATSSSAGTIEKYSFVGSLATGTWVSNGSYTTGFGGFGLAALVNGSTGANLYVSTGLGATRANSVIKLTDLAGYNTTINISTASNITLYTATSPNSIKGLAFAPKSLALPIALSSFNASLINSTVQLSWNTATEVNAGAFEVERSSDATVFTSIGTVAANNVASSYSYTDYQPLSGVSYYRLKLVDKDGSYKYSNTISINNLATTATRLSVYPNPIINTFTLTHDKAVNGAVIRVITIDGKIIFTQSIATGATQSTVDASKLIKGNYLVVFENNGIRSVTQFIK